MAYSEQSVVATGVDRTVGISEGGISIPEEANNGKSPDRYGCFLV